MRVTHRTPDEKVIEVKGSTEIGAVAAANRKQLWT
jgi:hypothetical protein